MSSKEMVDVVSEDGIVVKSITREEAEKENHTTENVLIFIFNSLGKVWLQLRPTNKKHYPGRWDISACGGIVSGESRNTAAQRETIEETGIETQLHFVESFLNVFIGDDGEERKRLSHLFIGISDDKPVANVEVDEFRIGHPIELKRHAQDVPELYVPSFIVELDKAMAGYNILNSV